MSELRNLKSRIDELESDLRERDDEVKVLKEQQQNATMQLQQQQSQNGGDQIDGGDKVIYVHTY